MRIARLYDPPGADDGTRVLVDRLWPRGVRKSDPRIDWWCKDAAPSSELRRWYNHDPQRYDEFVDRYRRELEGAQASAALDELRRLVHEGAVTLLTAAKDVEHGHLVVLAGLLGEEG